MATIISHRKTFVFIHIAKAAGTSVTRVLSPYADPRVLSSKAVRNGVHIIGHWLHIDLMRYTGRHVLPLHASASMLQERYHGTYSGDYFRFAVVRNPWDRLVSMYEFHKSPRKFVTDPRRFHYNSALSFSEYAEALCAKKPGNQVDMLFLDGNGDLKMDYIAKVENLALDMKVVFERIGLPPQSVPHRNKTSHKKYMDYYDRRTQSLVREAFVRAEPPGSGLVFCRWRGVFRRPYDPQKARLAVTAACRYQNRFGSPACFRTAFAVCLERMHASTTNRRSVSGLYQIS